VPHGAWWWATALVVSLLGLVLVTLLTRGRGATGLDRPLDDLVRSADAREELEALHAAAVDAGYRVLWVPTMIVLAWFARWRHLLVYGGTISLIATMAMVGAGESALARVVREGVTGSDEQLFLPAWPVLVLAAVAVGSLLALTPSGRARRSGWLVVVVLLVLDVALRAAVDLDPVAVGGLSALAGTSLVALAFLLLAPEQDFPVVYHREVKAHLRLDAERTERIRAAVLDQLGLDVVELEPYRLNGSAGSTPCRLRLAEGAPEYLFGKLYATNHLRSDRWYKFARVLRYGRLEDEAPFSSVRRLVEREDYFLRLLRDGGVRVPEPVGVVEVVPGQEYLLVCELVPDSVEILDARGPDGQLPDAVIDDALTQIRLIWAAGVAHRDIKPSNVLVQGDRVYLVDVSFGEERPSRWRQSVDLANMMLILALGATAPRVVQRSGALFEPAEVAEAFAATGSVTLPRQLRRLATDGHDLVEEFRDLLPPVHPVRIQRWSTRRVLLALATVGGLLLAAAVVVLNLRAGGLL
jgi:tRNA A-37 threonylcarbamoyl transferase component Bud32